MALWDESVVGSTGGEGSSLNTSDLHFDSKAQRHFSHLNEDDSYYYSLPIDEIEAKRLGFQHQVMRSILRTNFLAPLKDPLIEGISVLDVGTGPATWIIDMAKQFPKSEFHGCDVNDYGPPEGRFLPKNCQFQIGNVITGLPYKDDTFDYVHQRFLVAAISKPSWPQVIRELIRVIKPGGYLELVEYHLKYLDAGNAFEALSNLTNKMFVQKTIDIRASSKIGKFEIEAGLDNVKTSTLSLPIGRTFGGPIGHAWLENIKTCYAGLKPVLALSAGSDPEDVEQIFQQAWAECDERQVCGQFSVAVGRKPVGGEKPDSNARLSYSGFG